MKVRHHRADVTRGIIHSEDPGAQTIDVFSVTTGKAVAVGFVHRIVLPLLGHGHVLMAQDIGSDGGIQSETVHPVTGAVDQYGGGSVDHVTCGNLLASGLQDPGLGVVSRDLVRFAQD